MDAGIPSDREEAGELRRKIREAQAALAEAAESGPMQRDPYRLLLLGAISSLEASAETADAMIAARSPLPPKHMEALIYRIETATEKGANTGMRAEAKRYLRAIDRKLAVQAALAVIGAFAAGCFVATATLYSMSAGPFSANQAWQDIIATNPDPRPALASAAMQTDHNTGRRYYSGVSLWIDASRAAPTR